MIDDIDFIAQIEQEFSKDKSIDVLEIVGLDAQPRERVCLAIEILFQLRDYDYDWLALQLSRNDLALTLDAVHSIIRSIFRSAVEFRRRFLGSVLQHLVHDIGSLALKGPHDSFAIGDMVESVTLLDRIATGGLITTYRGFTENGMPYAVRVPRQFPLKSQAAVWDRLRTEFQVLEVLSNQGIEGIARQFSWIETSHGPASIAEFVEGNVLAEIRTSELSRAFALDIVAMVSSTLERIHDLGFIHGDVKPENVIITPDCKAILLDLNTALPTDISEITSEQFAGTLNYMSIESLAGGSSEVSIQRDIHALGALLYELLEGHPLNVGARKEDIFVAHAINLRSTDDLFTEKTPIALRSIIKFATNLDPDLRFDCCTDLQNAIEQARQDLDAEVTLFREPTSVAFRLGMGIGEIQYAINETIPLIEELEERGGVARLSVDQQNRLLGTVAISEESRVAINLASEMGIDLPEVDKDSYFIRLPMTWAVRPPQQFDEFRHKLQSALETSQRMEEQLRLHFEDAKQAAAFRLGYLISGAFAEPEFEKIKVEFQNKLSTDTLQKLVLTIEKTSNASRRKRLQAMANLLKPSLKRSLLC